MEKCSSVIPLALRSLNKLEEGQKPGEIESQRDGVLQ